MVGENGERGNVLLDFSLVFIPFSCVCGGEENFPSVAAQQSSARQGSKVVFRGCLTSRFETFVSLEYHLYLYPFIDIFYLYMRIINT